MMIIKNKNYQKLSIFPLSMLIPIKETKQKEDIYKIFNFKNNKKINLNSFTLNFTLNSLWIKSAKCLKIKKKWINEPYKIKFYFIT